MPESLLVTGEATEQIWVPTMHQIAEVLGVTVEGFETSYETEVADTDTDTEVGFGVIPAGKNVVVHPQHRLPLAAAACGARRVRRTCQAARPAGPPPLLAEDEAHPAGLSRRSASGLRPAP
jgi:hypothetical protein